MVDLVLTAGPIGLVGLFITGCGLRLAITVWIVLLLGCGWLLILLFSFDGLLV